MNRKKRSNILMLIGMMAGWMLLSSASLFAQGTLKGRVFDKETDEPLEFARVAVEGTYYGTLTDIDGNFEIKGIKPGDYSVRVTYTGFTEQLYTGITILDGGTKELAVGMKNANIIETVEIIGEAEIVDLNEPSTGEKFSQKDLENINPRDVAGLLENAGGVNKTPDGIQIRGGRVYETTYLVEGVSAKDPLAGTGFGVTVSSSAINELELITGGGDAEYGNGTAGVINTKLREGGNNLDLSASWTRDNLGWQPNSPVSWNTDIVNVALSGPLNFRFKKDSTQAPPKDKLFFFTSVDANMSDTYFGVQANQLYSSILQPTTPMDTNGFLGGMKQRVNDGSFWAPRQDNRWGNTVKLTWNIKPGMKISLSNQHSLNINQNSRSLQIIGNDAIMRPGFPYIYSLNLDNANTYTHHSNLTALNFKTLIDTSWTLDVTVGRLFTKLRADANGRPFRESTVDRIYDPASIVTSPVDVYNPDDSVVYVFPGPGLYNNDGIGTLWHDHHAQEITFKYKFTHLSKPGKAAQHILTLGHEHKEQEYQWIDVTRPWVGAPIVIDSNNVTPSTSIGSSSDVWAAKPATGGLFFQDQIRYKGITAFVGGRFDYWAPGKFADDAVANPDAPVVDAVREQYMDQTTPFMGRRWKARLLPKLKVTFPVTDNNMLFFNYGHSMLLPHPRFVYAGLDPVYQDRSFLSNLGNPNINPEVTVSYELGLKSKITKNLGLEVSAFYNDKFDYIVSRRILVKDQTGRFVEKTFFINQDYARIRGIDVRLTQRVTKALRLRVNFGYQIATGKSNTAAESALQIKQQGFVATTKEQFLAWDRPFDLKAMAIFVGDTSSSIFGLNLNHFRASLTTTLKSGLRYTPYVLTGYAETGRPIWELVEDAPYSKIGAPWFWADLLIARDVFFGKTKASKVAVTFEVKNLFNNKNAQLINGVTGRAYEEGDEVPFDWRDPSYPDPQDNGTPPYNPARYLQPRQVLFGLSFKI